MNQYLSVKHYRYIEIIYIYMHVYTYIALIFFVYKESKKCFARDYRGFGHYYLKRHIKAFTNC